jgi:hypothetical protein
VVRLMNWLVAADPSALSDRRATPLIDRIIAIYTDDFDLDPELARLLAQRVMGGAIAFVLFPGVLGARPGDVARQRALEVRIAGLLP